MLFNPDTTNYCNDSGSRIAFANNAVSTKLDMLPDDHPNKAEWKKGFEDFGKDYLEHISRANAANLAILDFDKQHGEEVKEYKRKTGKVALEAIQKEVTMLFKKLFDIQKKDHTKLLLKLKSLPNPEIPEKPVAKPKLTGWNALTGKCVDIVHPCDDECIKTIETYNAFEAQVLALCDNHPKKSQLISRCKEYDAKIHKHFENRDEIGDKVFAIRYSGRKSYVEDMIRMATGLMAPTRMEKMGEEQSASIQYIEGLEKELKAMGGQHKQLQAEFDARPKIES